MGTDDSKRSERRSVGGDCASVLLFLAELVHRAQVVVGANRGASRWCLSLVGLIILGCFLRATRDDDGRRRRLHERGHRGRIASGYMDDDGRVSEPGMVTVSFHNCDSPDGETEAVMLKFHESGEFAQLKQPPGKLRSGEPGGEEAGGRFPFGVVEAGESLTVFTNPGAIWSAWRLVEGSAAVSAGAVPEEQLVAIWRVREPDEPEAAAMQNENGGDGGEDDEIDDADDDDDDDDDDDADDDDDDKDARSGQTMDPKKRAKRQKKKQRRQKEKARRRRRREKKKEATRRRERSKKLAPQHFRIDEEADTEWQWTRRPPATPVELGPAFGHGRVFASRRPLPGFFSPEEAAAVLAFLGPPPGAPPFRDGTAAAAAAALAARASLEETALQVVAGGGGNGGGGGGGGLAGLAGLAGLGLSLDETGGSGGGSGGGMRGVGHRVRGLFVTPERRRLAAVAQRRADEAAV